MCTFKSKHTILDTMLYALFSFIMSWKLFLKEYPIIPHQPLRCRISNNPILWPYFNSQSEIFKLFPILVY